MIVGSIREEGTYRFLPRAIKECFEYAAARNMMEMEAGSHPIDGERLFVNVAEYSTTGAENRFWEAHRKYLDVHVMLDGTEQIDLNLIGNMKQGEYVEKEDFLPLEGEPDSHVIMRPGDFLICGPQDAHRTAVAADGPEMIKKAIFKVRLEGLADR